MRKEFRMFAGIILHPVRILAARFRRAKLEEEICGNIRENWWQKNHRRMHEMSEITNTAYTKSELYGNLYAGAL